MKKVSQLFIFIISLIFIQATSINELKQHDAVTLSQTKSE